MDAFTTSGALGRVRSHISTQNPLHLAWSIPDYLCSEDTLFVPLSLSNCGHEELQVELSCALEGTTTPQVCRLLNNVRDPSHTTDKGVLGTLTVPRSGVTDFIQIQVGPLTEQMQGMTVTVTATVRFIVECSMVFCVYERVAYRLVLMFVLLLRRYR